MGCRPKPIFGDLRLVSGDWAANRSFDDFLVGISSRFLKQKLSKFSNLIQFIYLIIDDK